MNALPLVHVEGMTRLTENVHVIPDRGVRGVPNVGIVVGADAALVIDTGMGERNGRLVLAAARTVSGDLPLFVMSTHVHPEHDLGAQSFPADATMIRSRSQVEEIAADGMRVVEDFRRASPAFAELLEGASFRPPDVVFDESSDVDLGGVSVRLIAMGANHTPGDTIASTSDGVLFAGDLVMAGTPALASDLSSVDRWLRSLDALEEIGPEVIVPSHGPIGDLTFLVAYRAYFHALRAGVRDRSVAGESLPQIVDALVREQIDRWPDADRIEGAVRAILREGAQT